jgi:transposase
VPPIATLAVEDRLEELERENARLRAENATLKKRLAVLEALVRDLRSRLKVNSTNSSMPPSSDKPWAVKPKKAPTGRRPGGQPGHPGKTRTPYRPDEVDHLVPLVPSRCGKCKHRFRTEDMLGDPLRHQVVEAPPVVAEVWEYLLHQALCPDCGEMTWAELPEGVPTGLIGPRLQAIYALLTGRGRLSRREAPEIVGSILGEKAVVSPGTVSAMERQTSEALKAAFDEALEAVRRSPVVNADETGWMEGRKRAWLWCAVTDALKVFRIDRNRSKDAFERLLGAFAGILGTDRWSAYRGLTPEQRQLCWAHLLRNFFGIEERGGEGATVGTEGLKVIDAIMHQWYRFKEGAITRRGLRRLLAPVRARFKRLLKRGLKNADRKARALCRDVLKWEASLWTFSKVPGVDPTNNISERSLRKAVLWRKNSYGSMSAEGSRYVERMLTVTETLRAQGRSILDFLEASIRAHLVGGAHPSLLPVRGP